MKASGARQLAQPRRLSAGTGLRVFCFAFFDASILALLPLYGMDKGLNEGLAVLLVTVVLTGDAMFQTRSAGWPTGSDSPRASELRGGFSLSLLALPLMLGSRIQLMAICLLLAPRRARFIPCRWCGRENLQWAEADYD